MIDVGEKQRSRLHGLDLLRLFSFLAITIHHLLSIIFYETDVPAVMHTNPILRLLEIEARSVSFSGQTILFLSAFLIARAERTPRKTLEVVLFAAIGWFAFCLYNYTDGTLFFWFWDIYPLIMLGLASAVAVKKIGYKAVYALGAFGFVMTFIEFWNWTDVFAPLSFYWRHVLIGECDADAAWWPVLPWVGIIWAGYAWGAFERSRIEQEKPSWFANWYRAEAFVWPVLMLASIPVLGRYFFITLGPGFACYAFRQPPLVFWGNFLFVVFVMRVSLLAKVREMLASIRVVRWIGDLRISRKFGIAYLLHYTLLEILDKTLKTEIRESEMLLLVCMLAVLPVTELLIRAFERIVPRRSLNPSSREGSV